MHRAACGMPRGADRGNKLVLERQLAEEAQTESRKGMKGKLEPQPLLSLEGCLLQGGGEGGMEEPDSRGRGWGRGQEPRLAQMLVTNIRPFSLLPYLSLPSSPLAVSPPPAPSPSRPPAPFPLAGA